jgi:hypothetical protein
MYLLPGTFLAAVYYILFNCLPACENKEKTADRAHAKNVKTHLHSF